MAKLYTATLYLGDKAIHTSKPMQRARVLSLANRLLRCNTLDPDDNLATEVLIRAVPDAPNMTGPA